MYSGLGWTEASFVQSGIPFFWRNGCTVRTAVLRAQPPRIEETHDEVCILCGYIVVSAKCQQ